MNDEIQNNTDTTVTQSPDDSVKQAPSVSVDTTTNTDVPADTVISNGTGAISVTDNSAELNVVPVVNTDPSAVTDTPVVDATTNSNDEVIANTDTDTDTDTDAAASTDSEVPNVGRIKTIENKLEALVEKCYDEVIEKVEKVESVLGFKEEPTATFTTMSISPFTTAAMQPGTVSSNTSAPVGTLNDNNAIDALKAKQKLFNEIELSIENFTVEGKEAIINALANGNAFTQTAIRDILKYTKDMHPKASQTPESISLYQINLFNSLKTIINNGKAEFRLMWSIILRIVYETSKDGAFDERYVRRLLPHLKLNKNSFNTFNSLIYIITATANVNSRALVVKSIDFSNLPKDVLTPDGIQNLVAFYKI